MTFAEEKLFIDPGVSVDATPEADKIITVETLCPTTVDGKRIPKGQVLKISVRQWRSTSRHYKFLAGPSEHAPENWQPPANQALHQS